MGEIKIFKNAEFGNIRTSMVNGEPWFVGKDVAEALGYVKARNAIATHVLEEDKKDAPIQGDLGGVQQMTIINESGLYSLILSSKLPNAKKFKHWVTSEVLPSIRKTGGYVNNEELFINTYLPFADAQTKMLFRTTLQTVDAQNKLIKEQQETISKQKEEIKCQENEIKYKKDVIAGFTDEINVADKRQILNRVVRHNNASYKDRWTVLYREFDNKYHVNTKTRMDNYNIKNKPKMKSRIDYIDKVMNKLPELYEIATKLYENDVIELVKEMYGVTIKID